MSNKKTFGVLILVLLVAAAIAAATCDVFTTIK